MQNNETMTNNESTKFIVTITLKLLLISVITALLLAGVNALTVERIAANVAAEKAAAIREIFPSATSNEQVTDVSAPGVNELYMVYEGDTLLGYAAGTAPLGFGGAMEIMAGVNVDGSLAGFKLIAHSETPGLGSRVGESAYVSLYSGVTAGTLADVDVITGSTISSEAVRTGIGSALDAYSVIFPSSDIITGGNAE